ncbi:MAG: IS66 family insertion sequence element accessory protein TnpB [Bacteroidales bacterium]|jgi:hypothetical protein
MLTEKSFKAIYDDFLESGLTIRSYCSNQRMNEAKFFYWRRRLNNQLPVRTGFVPLVIDKNPFDQRPPKPISRAGQPEAFPAKVTFFEITYPNGVRLKLHGDADLEMVRSLLLLAR